MECKKFSISFQAKFVLALLHCQVCDITVMIKFELNDLKIVFKQIFKENIMDPTHSAKV